MRIVVVGLEGDDPFVSTLVASLGEARVVAAAPRDAATACAGAQLVVVAPGSVASADVLTSIRDARRGAPSAPILAVGPDDASLAVALLKAGVSDYAVAGSDDVGAAARALLGAAPAAIQRDEPIAGLVGTSRAMAEVRALVRVAAGAEAHVLLEGETGTGKEVVARAVHRLGRRASRPFVPVNCAAVPETLAESEFFGHARGAFTGAVQEHPGALRLADGGTLFLDEIEDLSQALQAKLLRVVQDREVRA